MQYIVLGPSSASSAVNEVLTRPPLKREAGRPNGHRKESLDGQVEELFFHNVDALYNCRTRSSTNTKLGGGDYEKLTV